MNVNTEQQVRLCECRTIKGTLTRPLPPPALPALVCCIVAGSVYDLAATFDPAGLWALTAARRKEAQPHLCWVS